MTKKDILILVLFVIVVICVFKFSSDTNKENIVLQEPKDFTQKENNESDVVTKYVQDNIKTIATNSPVMGGSWYTVSIAIDPNLNAGSVVYEDGHIQSTAKFTYKYSNTAVTIDTFEVTE